MGKAIGRDLYLGTALRRNLVCPALSTAYCEPHCPFLDRSVAALKSKEAIPSYKPNLKEKKLLSCSMNYPSRGLPSVLVTSGVELVFQGRKQLFATS